ncbi:EAL domain-containing protein [Thalassiella azotivora]
MTRVDRALVAAVLLLGTGAVAYSLAPGALGWLYYVVAVGAVAVGWAARVARRPADGRAWSWVLGGLTAWVVADLVWLLEQLAGTAPFPAPSDAVYLSAYVLAGTGLVSIVRSRRDAGGVAIVLDAAIVTAGVAVLVVVLLLEPLAEDASLSVPARVVASAYPVGDLLLLAVAARMWASPGARTASYRLLVAALLTMGAGDIAWNVLVLTTSDTTVASIADSLWLASYLLLASAAAHPTMHVVAQPGPSRPVPTLTRGRIGALTAGLQLPAVVLILDGTIGDDVSWVTVGVGMLLLSGLVVARLNGLLHVVQQQAVQLAALARSDALTGAPNRRTWDHELSRACQVSHDTGQPLSVALLDLDHFKAYNDRHGHQRGDRLLKDAVRAWTAALGDGATLARYGGEEFAVLLPGRTVTEAVAELEVLRSLVPDGQTASIGVAPWHPDTDPATAVAHADEALYAAKHRGRDRVVSRTSLVEGALGQLLPDFHVVVQPIMELTSGAVVGHEALSRFPDQRADVATVFRRAHVDGHGDLLEAAAVRAAVEHPGRPAHQELFVNVSSRALASDRFWERLPDRLDGVVVELTEEVEHLDMPVVSASLDRLRERGARVALDDLGAGSAELMRLASLRPDVVKVDRSLVDGCARDPERSAVLRGIVAYAQALDVQVCAEGVEDADDLTHLRGLGISFAQGYLLGRPGAQWRTTEAAGV